MFLNAFLELELAAHQDRTAHKTNTLACPATSHSCFGALDAAATAGVNSDSVGGYCADRTSGVTTAASSLSHHHILDADGEAADAYAGGVPDRVGDGADCAGDADLADALDAERVHERVVLVDQDRL